MFESLPPVRKQKPPPLPTTWLNEYKGIPGHWQGVGFCGGTASPEQIEQMYGVEVREQYYEWSPDDPSSS
jgi:hypothetical protein